MLKKLIPVKIKAYLKLEALKGSNVACPCCEKTFITFLPYGLNKRANALCPNCGSLERHRLIWLYLNNETDIFKKTVKVLHVAPEKLFFEKFTSSANIDYVAGDMFTKGHTYPKGTLNMDITKIDFEANTFDVIICSHVLEHVPDDQLAMRELYRVLKTDGWAILQVPMDKELETTYEDFSITDPREREKAFGQFDHVRMYGLDYRQRLENAGFHISVINYYETFNRSEQFKYGLRDEDIYYCKKQK